MIIIQFIRHMWKDIQTRYAKLKFARHTNKRIKNYTRYTYKTLNFVVHKTNVARHTNKIYKIDVGKTYKHDNTIQTRKTYVICRQGILAIHTLK